LDLASSVITLAGLKLKKNATRERQNYQYIGLPSITSAPTTQSLRICTESTGMATESPGPAIFDNGKTVDDENFYRGQGGQTFHHIFLHISKSSSAFDYGCHVQIPEFELMLCPLIIIGR
jgi:hypothetical protein